MALAYDLKTTTNYFSERLNVIAANAGTLIFAGVGLACALVGGLFLDYAALDTLFHLGAEEWRSFGIFLVEVGVGLAVMSIMASLFWDLGSGGNMDEGL